MLKIYGANMSSPANKVRFVANALGLKYEYVPVNIRTGENKTEQFLKLHPAGKIPVIDDDGFALFESNAIIKYLAQKNKSPIYPQDLKARARVDQWMDFAALHVGTAVSRVLFNRVFAPRINVPVDERSLQDGIIFLGRFLPVVDAQLKENKFIAGNELSLADFSLLSALDPCEVIQVDLSAYNGIVRWRNALKKEAFYTQCHSSYEDALAALAAK